MYDVTNEKSFDNIRSWIREIEDEVSIVNLYSYISSHFVECLNQFLI